jgi:hypothetical protein
MIEIREYQSRILSPVFSNRSLAVALEEIRLMEEANDGLMATIASLKDEVDSLMSKKGHGRPKGLFPSLDAEPRRKLNSSASVVAQSWASVPVHMQIPVITPHSSTETLHTIPFPRYSPPSTDDETGAAGRSSAPVATKPTLRSAMIPLLNLTSVQPPIAQKAESNLEPPVSKPSLPPAPRDRRAATTILPHPGGFVADSHSLPHATFAPELRNAVARAPELARPSGEGLQKGTSVRATRSFVMDSAAHEGSPDQKSGASTVWNPLNLLTDQQSPSTGKIATQASQNLTGTFARRIPRPPDVLCQFPYTGRPFDGIFARWSAEARGNPARMGYVHITGNSADAARDGDLPELVNYDWNRCWTSQNISNSWIQFDFGAKTLFVRDYSLKTYWLGPGYSHMKSWVLEGCNAAGIWMTLDNQEDCHDLNGRSRVQTFPVAPSPVDIHILRIRQTAKNHHGDNYLILAAVEFFGDMG